MAFGVVVQRLDRHPGLAQGLLHHLRVRDRRALVLATGGQEHRHLDPVGDAVGRHARQRAAFADPFAQVGLARAAALDVAVGVHGRQVVDADIAGRAAIQPGLLGGAHQRRIRAVTGAVDADPARVGNTLIDQPARRVGDVVLHRAAPLARAGFGEGMAIAARAAEVDLQHRVPGGGEHLRAAVKAPLVLDTERAAMGQHHHRQVLAGGAVGQGEVPVQRQSVARGKFDRAHFRHLFRLEPVAPTQQVVGFPGEGVENVKIAGIAVARHLHQGQAAIAGLRGDAYGVVGKGRFQAAVQACLGRRIVEEGRTRLAVHVERADRDHAAIAVNDTCRIAVVVAQHLLAGFAGDIERQ